MRPSSAKAKGRRLQSEVREAILREFSALEPDDVRCAIMGESGEDIKLSPRGRRFVPFAIECKCVEKLNIWSALEQAQENARTHNPLLVFRRNRGKTYAALPLNVLLNLLGNP